MSLEVGSKADKFEAIVDGLRKLVELRKKKKWNHVLLANVFYLLFGFIFVGVGTFLLAWLFELSLGMECVICFALTVFWGFGTKLRISFE